MHIANTRQRFQDWFTQQWVILWGRKIDRTDHEWLLCPFGTAGVAGDNFIQHLIDKENLVVENGPGSKGLLKSFDELNLPAEIHSRIPQPVIDFYENTSEYGLQLSVSWNPFFKPFGFLVKRLFSNRINQLNIPLRNGKDTGQLSNEIIRLVDAQSNQLKYTIWLRKHPGDETIVYMGVYGTCNLPDGSSCVKAAFPLPNGNATVLLKPGLGPGDEFILNSSGRKMGDAGFYFLLNDKKSNTWAQYIRSFRDQLSIRVIDDSLVARQTLRLWGLRVLTFDYSIRKMQ